MSKFVGDGERGTQAVVLHQRTAGGLVTHGPQFGQPQSLTLGVGDGRVAADILPVTDCNNILEKCA